MIEYAKELGDVLRTFDTNKFVKFIKKNKSLYSLKARAIFLKNRKNKRFLLGCMAKIVMARTDMDEQTKARAKEILAEMNWSENIF